MGKGVRHKVLMKKKRLLILIWNLGIGGMQKRVRDIVKDISRNRLEWEVYILVKYKSPRCFNEEIEKLPRVFVRYFPDHHILYNKWASLPWILKEVFIIRPASCLTFLSHFSLLLLFVKYILFWRKSKLVLNEGVFTSKFLPIHTHRPDLEARLIKAFYRYSNRIIAPTIAIKNDLAINFSVPAGMISIISNWTLIPPQKPLPKVFDLIYAGRFEREKNLLTMLEVVRIVKQSHPKIKVCLLGEGSLELELRRKVDQYGLNNNVSFSLSQPDIIPWLRRSKVLIMTTLNEGLPNVVLEAAMCGVPTISSYYEGVEEIIKHKETGMIARSVEEFASNAFLLLADSKKRTMLGMNAVGWVKKRFHASNQQQFIDTLLDRQSS